MTPSNAPAAAGSAVEELIRQREQLRAWIGKLDEVKTDAPSRVTQRVRADYEDRLRRVTEDLSAHREEIERDLESLRAELQGADERRSQAVDTLEEQRLRHMIGELDEGAWNDARPALEQAVAAADEELERTRGEVERLASLAGEIAGAPEAEAEPEPEPEPVAASAPPGPEAAPEPAPTAEAPPEPLGYAPSPEAQLADEWEPEIFAGAPEAEALTEAASAAVEEPAALDEAPAPETFAAPSAQADAPAGAEAIGGEELAAWISEVEAEAGRSGGDEADAGSAGGAAAAGPAAAADDWDPFANEFGGAPASPQTQPGDAADDLPWLDAIDGAAGQGWTPAPAAEEEPGDDLAFLKDLETGAAPEPAAGGDLAADDLAFLEELDRAISGGAQRPPSAAASPPATPAAGGFVGGSGDGFAPASGGADAPRKKGEALLCKECGAINEPQAWYCEICGSEL